jgi:hypothetical protein
MPTARFGFNVGDRIRHVQGLGGGTSSGSFLHPGEPVGTDQQGVVVEKPADGYANDTWSTWVVWDGTVEVVGVPGRMLGHVD